MSEYVYHDHARPFCGQGCPAYGASPLLQRYPRQPSARTAADLLRSAMLAEFPFTGKFSTTQLLDEALAEAAAPAGLDVEVLAEVIANEPVLKVMFRRFGKFNSVWYEQRAEWFAAEYARLLAEKVTR